MDYPPCGERQYSIPSLLHGASGFFQVLPIALTLATFMERRHPVAIAETPRRQAPYHAHVRGCTMRMSGGVPCAWSRGYHAHATVSFGWHMGYETRDSMSPYSLYIGRCRLMAASFRFRPQAPAIPKWDSPCPTAKHPYPQGHLILSFVSIDTYRLNESILSFTSINTIV